MEGSHSETTNNDSIKEAPESESVSANGAPLLPEMGFPESASTSIQPDETEAVATPNPEGIMECCPSSIAMLDQTISVPDDLPKDTASDSENVPSLVSVNGDVQKDVVLSPKTDPLEGPSEALLPATTGLARRASLESSSSSSTSDSSSDSSSSIPSSPAIPSSCPVGDQPLCSFSLPDSKPKSEISTATTKPDKEDEAYDSDDVSSLSSTSFVLTMPERTIKKTDAVANLEELADEAEAVEDGKTGDDGGAKPDAKPATTIAIPSDFLDEDGGGAVRSPPTGPVTQPVINKMLPEEFYIFDQGREKKALDEEAPVVPDDVEERLKQFDPSSSPACGTISAVIQRTVVVDAIPDTCILDEGSVVCTEEKVLIGAVVELFGLVLCPAYVINIHDSKKPEEFKKGMKVWVLPSAAKIIYDPKQYESKGCDASWKDDVEVPEHLQDFSDDEEEMLFKQQRKMQKKQAKLAALAAAGGAEGAGALIDSDSDSSSSSSSYVEAPVGEGAEPFVDPDGEVEFDKPILEKIKKPKKPKLPKPQLASHVTQSTGMPSGGRGPAGRRPMGGMGRGLRPFGPQGGGGMGPSAQFHRHGPIPAGPGDGMLPTPTFNMQPGQQQRPFAADRGPPFKRPRFEGGNMAAPNAGAVLPVIVRAGPAGPGPMTAGAMPSTFGAQQCPHSQRGFVPLMDYNVTGGVSADSLPLHPQQQQHIHTQSSQNFSQMSQTAQGWTQGPRFPHQQQQQFSHPASQPSASFQPLASGPYHPQTSPAPFPPQQRNFHHQHQQAHFPHHHHDQGSYPNAGFQASSPIMQFQAAPQTGFISGNFSSAPSSSHGYNHPFQQNSSYSNPSFQPNSLVPSPQFTSSQQQQQRFPHQSSLQSQSQFQQPYRNPQTLQFQPNSTKYQNNPNYQHQHGPSQQLGFQSQYHQYTEPYAQQQPIMQFGVQTAPTFSSSSSSSAGAQAKAPSHSSLVPYGDDDDEEQAHGQQQLAAASSISAASRQGFVAPPVRRFPIANPQTLPHQASTQSMPSQLPPFGNASANSAGRGPLPNWLQELSR